VFEADKMSLEQTRYHWKTVINPLKQDLGPLLGKSFRHFLIDSYEVGDQNWTSLFRDEFKRRKGYDPLPWLVTLRGNNVGDAEQTARAHLYRHIRHSKYSGFFLFLLGSSITWPTLVTLLMLLVLLVLSVVYYQLVKLKEADALTRFGEEYLRYEVTSGMFWTRIVM